MPGEPMSETSREVARKIFKSHESTMDSHQRITMFEPAVDAITTALDAAVEQERERCALIADGFINKITIHNRAQLVAAAIRRSNHDETR